MTRNKKQESILRTIESLKEEILSLPSAEDVKKLSKIKTIIQRWFLQAGWYDMDDRPDIDRIKEAINNKTIHDIAWVLLNTYNTIYDIIDVLDILIDDD